MQPNWSTTIYALTFTGLNFHGTQILAIFVFLFPQMQGLILSFVDLSFPLSSCRIVVIDCFSGGSCPSKLSPFLYFLGCNRHANADQLPDWSKFLWEPRES